MAITTTTLSENNNYGLRLTAPDLFADVLTLDLSTGDCTSPYFPAKVLADLQTAALNVFQIVPYAERAGGALNLLGRLLTITVADDAVLTLSAVVVGDSATLRATINAAPGSLVLHVPSSVSGGLAFSVGSEATGGGGGGGVTAVTASLPLTSSGGAAPDISLNNSGVVAATYGSATSVAVVTVDAKGLVMTAVDTPITFPPSGVTSVTASPPLSSSGGATPDISFSGVLPIANGGTHQGAFTANGVVTVHSGGTFLTEVLGSAPADVLTWNGTAWVSAAVPAGGLTNWTEAVDTAAPNATVPVTSFTSLNAATDVDAALVAKGSGATVAQVPNAGFSGGDKRGTYATDWQKSRLSASQVASGTYATVSGGWRNTASGPDSTVVGGFNNVASGDRTVVGGASNTAAGLGSIALGQQNNANTAYSSAIGSLNNATGNNASAIGYNNTASGPSSFAAGTGSTASADTAVALGAGNASGNFSLAVGIGNVANNSVAAAVGGQNNAATGQWALATGGNGGTASGNYAGTLAGLAAIANSYAQLSGGAYPHGFSGTDATSLVATDPLLTLGNGTGLGVSASNALTLLKDGSLGLGLGQTKPTERLDVAGNAKFSGALMPNNLPGTLGQYLASAGAGTAPTWATLPSSGPDAGQREPALARYDFTGTPPPTVPTAPAAPTFTGTEYFVGSGGGEYATLALAVAVASPGDIITVRAGYTTTEISLTTVNVNKSLEIRGENRATSGISGVAGSAGGNVLITIPAGTNDVWIHDLTITNNVTAAQDPGGISANIGAQTMTQAFPAGSTGLRFERLNLVHWKFGIALAGAGWVINDCSFACRLTLAGTNIRHVGHYGQTGDCFITNCVLEPTTDPTPRSQGVYMTTNFPGVGTYRPGQAGNLVIQNLSQSGVGNWNAYYLQDVLHEPGAATGAGYNNPATPGSFGLWLDNVVFTTPYSGNPFSLVEATGTVEPLSFFNNIYIEDVTGQARTTGDNKGFLAVAGSTGTGRNIGAPTVGFWVFGTNAFNSILPSTTYAEGSTVDDLLGVLTTNYAVPSPLLAPTTPVTVPSGTLTADSVALNLGDRVFLFNTSDATFSGLYEVQSGTWTRVTDMAAAANAAGFFWWVLNGTTYGNTGWVVSSASGSAVVGTNALSFRQFGGLGGESYTVGNAADWAAPAPQNVWTALDRLAAAVSGLLAGPIP